MSLISPFNCIIPFIGVVYFLYKIPLCPSPPNTSSPPIFYFKDQIIQSTYYYMETATSQGPVNKDLNQLS